MSDCGTCSAASKRGNLDSQPNKHDALQVLQRGAGMQTLSGICPCRTLATACQALGEDPKEPCSQTVT